MKIKPIDFDFTRVCRDCDEVFFDSAPLEFCPACATLRRAASKKLWEEKNKERRKEYHREWQRKQKGINEQRR